MKKVLVGMSGGVDSSVAALLLKDKGYEVVGATMVLYDEEKIDGGCLSSSSINDAKAICDKLGIEHHVINLKKEFKKHVIDNFIECYKKGFTPNPCVECNKYLKFGILFDFAKKIGCNYIATGHYAKTNGKLLMKSDSKEKDQSYFLYGIKKEVIPHIIFPLESFNSKEEIRKIAQENDLLVAKKKDSQEICFIPNNSYTDYLIKNMENMPSKGDFVDKSGEIIGKHKGIIYYTVGQRKGLGISSSKPLYVIEIDKENNVIVLGEEKDLYKRELVCSNVNILVDELPSEITAKIRFRANDSKAKLEILKNGDVKLVFDEPQRAITKGQSVVFYKDDVVIGGGIIL